MIHHDARKLVERLQLHTAMVSEVDFCTLVHQCRKRKWAAEVGYLLSFVNDLVNHGMPSVNLPPQPHLQPSLHGLLEASIDAYFACGEVLLAKELFDSIIYQKFSIDQSNIVNNSSRYQQPEIDQSVSFSQQEDLNCFFWKSCKGFASNGKSDLVLHVYWYMRYLDHMPSGKLVLAVMRSLGKNAFEGLSILSELLSAIVSLESTDDLLQQYMVIGDVSVALIEKAIIVLLESVGVLQSFESLTVLKSFLSKSMLNCPIR